MPCKLDNELRTLIVGDLRIHDYSKKLKSLSELLSNMDSPVSERNLVIHMINGLNDKFDSIINVIKHKSPFSLFSVARLMLIMEEYRLKKITRPTPTSSHYHSYHDVLYTISRYNNNNNNRGGRGRGRGGRNNNNNRNCGGRYNNNGSNTWYNSPHATTVVAIHTLFSLPVCIHTAIVTSPLATTQGCHRSLLHNTLNSKSAALVVFSNHLHVITVKQNLHKLLHSTPLLIRYRRLWLMLSVQ